MGRAAKSKSRRASQEKPVQELSHLEGWKESAGVLLLTFSAIKTDLSDP